MIETSKKIYNCINFLSQISQFINVIFSNVTQPMLPSTFPMVFSSTAGFEKSIVRNSKCSKNILYHYIPVGDSFSNTYGCFLHQNPNFLSYGSWIY